MARNMITGIETQKMQEYTQEQIDRAEHMGIAIPADVKEQIFEYANLVGEEEKVRTLVRNLADAVNRSDEDRVEELLDDAKMDIQDLPDPTIGKLEPLIMREEGSGTRKEAEKQLKKMGISLDDLNIVATIENPEAIKRSVKSGLGITIISRLAAADEIQAGEVLEFPFSQDGSGRNLNLVYNKNYKLPAAAEHVRELIIEKYELQKQSLQ